MLEWDVLDDYAVVELGANRAGEIDALAGLCRPHIGVITCIGEAHLGGFGSQRAIAEAKSELLASVPDNGWMVLGGDDAWLRRMSHRCAANTCFVGRAEDCDLLATDVAYRQGELKFNVEDCRFRIPVWGRHFLTSALSAIAVARLFDLPLEEIAESLAGFQQVEQRCEVRQIGGVTVVDDTYNASPTAARAALEVVRDLSAPGRRIVVLGDMAELGSSSADWHAQLGEQTVTVCGADIVIACGEFAADVVAGAYEAGLPRRSGRACRTAHDALLQLMACVQPGDAVLIKGSRMMKMETIIAGLTQPRLSQAA